MRDPFPSRARPALLALWPAGLLLALANAEIPAVTGPVFAVLAAAYVAAAAVAIRCAPGSADPVAVLPVAAAVGLFAVAGGTGEPTAAAPSALLLNTLVLFAVAVVLLGVMTRLWLRLRHAPGAGSAAPLLLLFVLGTGGFLLNLLARVAIVQSGAAPQQLAVQATHWSAAEYLTGLDGPADFVGYTLVWLDLVQLAYVASAYLAAAALALLAGAAGAVTARAARVSAGTAAVLAALLIGAVLAAIAFGSETAAAIAFGTSIPFMATLVPFALGAALLGRAPTHQEQK
ncbi:hypothetical protein [Nocardia sp. NPDC057353]|uniref:hypothetical protein n=1 Tax=Nocardia sp. NPDC057353 TaxID=3346104 RepID=UPI0036389E2E